jgi:hypothetical protein
MRQVLAILIVFGALAALRAAEGPEWVEQRVNELQPTAVEKRFDQVGWARDIREAKRLAKENQRPVFLFTHDGRINIGRC